MSLSDFSTEEIEYTKSLLRVAIDLGSVALTEWDDLTEVQQRNLALFTRAVIEEYRKRKNEPQ